MDERSIVSASSVSLCSRTGGFEGKYEVFNPKNISSLCMSESPFHEGRVGSRGFLVFWESTRQSCTFGVKRQLDISGVTRSLPEVGGFAG